MEQRYRQDLAYAAQTLLQQLAANTGGELIPGDDLQQVAFSSL